MQIPKNPDNIVGKTDVNVMQIDKNSHYLYAGCGDNNVYVFNLEDGKLIRTLEGHTDFIHWLHIHGSQIVTCSEDGNVKLWDVNEKKSHSEIIPYKNDKLARPSLGKWVGSVSLNDDWLVSNNFQLFDYNQLELFTRKEIYHNLD